MSETNPAALADWDEFNRGILEALGLSGNPVAAIEIHLEGGKPPHIVVTQLVMAKHAGLLTAKFLAQKCMLVPQAGAAIEVATPGGSARGDS